MNYPSAPPDGGCPSLPRATSLGAVLLGRRGRALIHSVFAHAVNFRFEGTGELCTLLATEDERLPQGITLAPFEAGRLRGLRPGGILRLEGGLLWADAGPLLSLEGAPIYEGRLPSLPGGRLDGRQERARDRLGLLLAGAESPEGGAVDSAEAELARRLARGLDLLAASAEAAEREPGSLPEREGRRAQEVAALSLLGLGLGLTPSGDDLLVGFLAGRSLLEEGDSAGAAWNGSLAALLRLHAGRSGEVSQAYLLLASERRFAGRLRELCLAICRGEAGGPLEAAATRLFSTGQSSGRDLARGLLAALGWAPPGFPLSA